MVFRHEVDNITDGHSSHVWKVSPKYIAYILAKSVEKKVLKSLAQWRQKTISWSQLKVFDYIELNMKFCKLRSLIRVRKKDKTGNDHWLPADECLSHTCPPSFITYYQWVTSWWPCTSFILSLQVKIDKNSENMNGSWLTNSWMVRLLLSRKIKPTLSLALNPQLLRLPRNWSVCVKANRFDKKWGNWIYSAPQRTHSLIKLLQNQTFKQQHVQPEWDFMTRRIWSWLKLFASWPDG